LFRAQFRIAPRHATPRHAAPRHATPRHATPRHAVRLCATRSAGQFPLLRLLLQPPPDGLLQPGGTFGVLLDFRASHGAAAAAAAAGSASMQPICLQVRAWCRVMIPAVQWWHVMASCVDGRPSACCWRCWCCTPTPQVVALLESEEVVLPPHAPSRAAAGVTAARRLHAEQTALTAHSLAASITLSIPLTAPPSFRTPMVAHKWLLRFELTLGRPKQRSSYSAARQQAEELQPSDLDTEQLLWALPLVVYPPPPSQGGPR
jgi:hypothetical protein